jgi:protein ImuA
MDSELFQQLAQRIRDIEANEGASESSTMTTAIPALEAVLPGGLPGGALVEVLSAAEGGGAWTLALLLAKQACAERKILVLADEQRSFYPPAAARLGIDLQRTLVLRPPQKNVKDWSVASLVQSLRCPAVGAALGRFARLSSAAYRGLQLAAETGGGVGFLVLPASARGAPSFAAVRLLVTPIASRQARRRIQIEVVRVRGQKAGQSFLLEIDHETDPVRLSAPLAAPTLDASTPRIARAAAGHRSAEHAARGHDPLVL